MKGDYILNVLDNTKFYVKERVTVNKRRPDFKDDAQWQEYFTQLKGMVKPSRSRRMRAPNPDLNMVNGTYAGDTQYKRYVSFINDVLHEIRHKHCDYCYFIYQIADLLRFEHERLRTKYIKDTVDDPGYIMVWLE